MPAKNSQNGEEMLQKITEKSELFNHPMLEGAAVFLETVVRTVFAYEHFPYDFHQIWTSSTNVRDIFSLLKYMVSSRYYLIDMQISILVLEYAKFSMFKSSY